MVVKDALGAGADAFASLMRFEELPAEAELDELNLLLLRQALV